MSVTPRLDYCVHGFCETEHCRTCEIMGVCPGCVAELAADDVHEAADDPDDDQHRQ